MLMTKWGEDLNKNCPLSEYPRPEPQRYLAVRFLRKRGNSVKIFV